MSGSCHLCGVPEVSPCSRPGSPLCWECLPTQEHMVSMQAAPDGGSLAVCQCGWRSQAGGQRRFIVQDARVQMHWRAVIRRTLADYEAIHGKGELAGVAASLTVLAGVATLLLAALP